MIGKIAVDFAKYKKLSAELPHENLVTASIVIHWILLVPSPIVFIFIGFYSIRKYTHSDHFHFIIDAIDVMIYRFLSALTLLYILYNINPFLTIL
jgi:hypothetical protein